MFWFLKKLHKMQIPVNIPSSMNTDRRNPKALTAPEAAEDLPVVALVGISGYGRVHLSWLEDMAANQRLHFAAAVVINPDEEREACERLRARGVRLYEDWRAMLEAWKGRLDLCMAPVPIHLHAEVTVAALEAGANVLVEKPIAATVGQARAVQAAEHRTGRWVAVGYQDIYSASTIRIAAQLAAGRIGRLRSVRWLGLWPRPESYYRRTSWAGRVMVAGQPVRDSPLNNAMAHYLNLSLHWAWAGSGLMPEPMVAEAELFRSYLIESFDTAVVRLRTSAGVTIHAAVSHCCPEERPITLRIFGDEGELQWIHRQKAVWLSGGVEIEEFALGDKDEAMKAMFEAVLARLDSPLAQICTSEQALLQVRAIEALPVEIHCIPPPFSRRISKNGDSSMVVKNIAADLAACLHSGALPSEIGVEWAKSANFSIK